MKLKPFGQRVLVKRHADDTIGPSHIIVRAETEKKTSLEGHVIGVGPDCVWVKEGEHIIFGRYAPFELPVRDEEYKEILIMNEEDILCKVEN